MTAQNKQGGNVRFIRVRGRIIPVRGDKPGKGGSAKLKGQGKTKLVDESQIARSVHAREGFLGGLGSGFASVVGGGLGYSLSKKFDQATAAGVSRTGRLGKIASRVGAVRGGKFGVKLGAVMLGYGAAYAGIGALMGGQRGQVRAVPPVPKGKGSGGAR